MASYHHHKPIERFLVSTAIGYTIRYGLSLLYRNQHTIPFFPFPGTGGKVGVNAYIGGRPFQAVMDSGADINSINQKTAQMVGITRFPRLAKKEPYEGAGSTSYTQFKIYH
jgi:hypothetical protein